MPHLIRNCISYVCKITNGIWLLWIWKVQKANHPIKWWMCWTVRAPIFAKKGEITPSSLNQHVSFMRFAYKILKSRIICPIVATSLCSIPHEDLCTVWNQKSSGTYLKKLKKKIFDCVDRRGIRTPAVHNCVKKPLDLNFEFKSQNSNWFWVPSIYSTH